MAVIYQRVINCEKKDSSKNFIFGNTYSNRCYREYTLNTKLRIAGVPNPRHNNNKI